MKSPIFFAFILALTWPFSAFSQEDTIRTQKGIVPVSVQSFTSSALQVERSLPSGKKQMSIPYSELESVRFADGFEVRFQDGELIRDNLLSAPKYSSVLWSVKAEDAIDLTQDEIRQYYGDRLYQLSYRHYKAQFFTGLGKIGVGTAGYLATRKWLNPSVWLTVRLRSYGETTTSEGTLVSDTQLECSDGDLYPGWYAVENLFLGAVFAGVMDCSVSMVGMHFLRRNHETMTGPSLRWTKAEFWGGTALVAAGAGTMGIFASRLASHRKWHYYVSTVNGTVTKNVHEGEQASASDWYGLLAGAIVVNVGLSAIQLSQARLSSFRKLEGTPYAMQVDLGPAPSGYGLTVRF